MSSIYSSKKEIDSETECEECNEKPSLKISIISIVLLGINLVRRLLWFILFIHIKPTHQSPDSDNSLRTFLHYLVITEALTILLSDFMNICDKSIKKHLNSIVLPCIIVLGIVTIGVITYFILAFSLGILQSTGDYSQALFTWLYIYFPIAILCNVAMIIGWYKIRAMLKQDKEQLNNADTSTITSSK